MRPSLRHEQKTSPTSPPQLCGSAERATQAVAFTEVASALVFSPGRRRA